MKRFIALICALVLAASLLAFPASAAEKIRTGKLGDSITYSFNPETGTVLVEGEGPMWDFTLPEPMLEPPDTLSPFALNWDVKTVIISDGITSIGEFAFTGCTEIETLRLGRDVRTIAESAFDAARNLAVYALCDAVDMEPKGVYGWTIEEDATFYYAPGTQGWTTPEWNGYKAQPLPYFDVDLERWYGLDVMWMHQMGYMEGVGGGRFAPQATVTRAQLVTLLSRVRPDLLTENYSDDPVYSDVPADAWYAKAVCWANSAQVVRGYPDGTFRPNDPVTREQLAVMLMRCEKPEQAAPEDALDGFADAADVSAYAQSAMRWAVSNGILQGVGGDAAGPLLSPGSTATRAQLAALTARCVRILDWDEKAA